VLLCSFYGIMQNGGLTRWNGKVGTGAGTCGGEAGEDLPKERDDSL